MPGWMKRKLGKQIAWRNMNNLRHSDDTTLKAEREEELKSLLMRVNEESEKAGLKRNIQKAKILASSPITSWQIDGEKVETLTDFIFLVSKITVDSGCSHETARFKTRDIIAYKGPYSQSCGFSRSHVWM